MKKSQWIAAALAGLLVSAGCSQSVGGTITATVRAARPVPPKSARVPKGLEGVGLTGTGLSAVLPDPKHPGKLLWHIWAKSFGGNFASGNATVREVTALMFHGGKRAAKMTAPTANYNDGRKTIFASGGVSYASLTQPGTWMRARTVTYHADTGDGVARGGVLVHDGKHGGTVSTPIVYFDSSLQTVQSYPLHGGR